MASFITKDIVFAFFGLFLSIVFTQGFFKRIYDVVYEFSFSVIPFKYVEPNKQNSDRYTKKFAEQRHMMEIKRVQSVEKISKSIKCNAAIGMTVLAIATTSLAFKAAGIPLSKFAILWGSAFVLLFVYLNYIGWKFARKDEYWHKLPQMSSSRYNLLLTVAAVIFGFFAISVVFHGLGVWVSFGCILLIIYLATRIHRVPHLNKTHARAKYFDDDESYYLKDIGKETWVMLGVFSLLSILQFYTFEMVKDSTVGVWVEGNALLVFLGLFAVPFGVFFITFFREIGWTAIQAFLTFAPKKRLSR